MRILDRRVLLELFWMALFLGLVAALMLAGASLARAETPGDCPNLPSPVSGEGPGVRANENETVPLESRNPPERRPHPAWRYEKPVGHRAAVVRVYCQDDVRTRSIGSGTLVRWGANKVVVLTARHVVQDARKIVVELHNKKTHKARVLKVDAVWDCAVLGVVGKPEGVAPAELELGDAAMQKEGSRLESCGYGPDGRLACNTGLFISYRRSTKTPNGPDDWFEISGHARQGDSGGGIFNQRGRLVGVLWGTNGEVVVGVQAGRIHVLLDEALADRHDATEPGDCPNFRANENGTVPFEAEPPANNGQERQGGCGCPGGCRPRGPTVFPRSYRPLQFSPRHPTPPKPSQDLTDLPMPGDCPDSRVSENGTVPFSPMPGPESAPEEASAKKPGTNVLPWRGKAEQRDADIAERQRQLLDALEADRQARLESQRQATTQERPATASRDETGSDMTPLGAGLCVLGGIAIGFVIYFSAQKQAS
jgi:hypothetical protein